LPLYHTFIRGAAVTHALIRPAEEPTEVEYALPRGFDDVAESPLEKAEEQQHAPTVPHGSLSNAQLRSKALEMARDLRDFEGAGKEEQTRKLHQRWAENKPLTDAADDASGAVQRERVQVEFNNRFKVRANQMLDALHARLPAEERASLPALHFLLVGPTPISDVADEIERLARVLPES
jgi:hypothetical protein